MYFFLHIIAKFQINRGAQTKKFVRELHGPLKVLRGAVAQMVERSLSMWEVRGSIPRISKYLFHIL